MSDANELAVLAELSARATELASRTAEAADECQQRPGLVERNGYVIADLYSTISALADLTAHLARKTLP